MRGGGEGTHRGAHSVRRVRVHPLALRRRVADGDAEQRGAAGGQGKAGRRGPGGGRRLAFLRPLSPAVVRERVADGAAQRRRRRRAVVVVLRKRGGARQGAALECPPRAAAPPSALPSPAAGRAVLPHKTARDGGRCCEEEFGCGGCPEFPTSPFWATRDSDRPTATRPRAACCPVSCSVRGVRASSPGDGAQSRRALLSPNRTHGDPPSCLIPAACATALAATRPPRARSSLMAPAVCGVVAAGWQLQARVAASSAPEQPRPGHAAAKGPYCARRPPAGCAAGARAGEPRLRSPGVGAPASAAGQPRRRASQPPPPPTPCAPSPPRARAPPPPPRRPAPGGRAEPAAASRPRRRGC